MGASIRRDVRVPFSMGRRAGRNLFRRESRSGRVDQLRVKGVCDLQSFASAFVKPAGTSGQRAASTGQVVQSTQIVSCREGCIYFGQIAVRERDLVQLRLSLGRREPVSNDTLPEALVDSQAVPRSLCAFDAA